MHAGLLSEAVQQLGYTVIETGKHGMFEIDGVSPTVIEAFSTRRRQVLVRAERLDHQTPKSFDSAQRTSRRRKLKSIDREELLAMWRALAADYAVDFRELALAAVGLSSDRPPAPV